MLAKDYGTVRFVSWCLFGCKRLDVAWFLFPGFIPMRLRNGYIGEQERMEGFINGASPLEVGKYSMMVLKPGGVYWLLI
jgi:hypothetical protein